MRRLLVLLCGCNQVFGLTPTQSIDASFFDAPPRKPPQCPAIGENFVFSPSLHQLHLDCQDYDVSTSANLAVALCIIDSQLVPSSGPIDGPLSPIPGMPQNTQDFIVDEPSLDPDGTLLLLETLDLSTFVPELRVYHRSGTEWLRDANVPNGPPNISNPSRGPEYHVLGTNGTSGVSELAFVAGGWQVVRTHTLAMLGVPSVGAIWLSADGLRMLFVANAFAGVDNRYMAYADRATIDGFFGTARSVGVPLVNDAFITEGCGRIYFSGLHSIFYAETP